MTDETRAKLLASLEFAFGVLGRSFNSMIEDGYARLLKPLDDELGTATIDSLLREKAFPPTIAEIKQRYAELASPFPSPEDAWTEVFDKMGRTGRQKGSHPIVSAVVKDMGGLEALWHAYRFAGTPMSILREQFLKFYQARLSNWRLEVSTVLDKKGLKGARRDYPALFPAYEPKRLAASPPDTTPRQIEAQKQEVVPMPDEVRKKLAAVGLSFGNGSRKEGARGTE